MDWNGYEIFHSGVSDPPETLPRAEARTAFNRCMEARPVRTESLRRLLEANGVEMARTDAGLQDLNDWFVANIESDPNYPGRLTEEWYSVVNDVALFLGDVIIERCPGLHWEFYVWGKKNVSYQRHVIMGFTEIANPKYNLDIDQAVAAYGHRIVTSRGSVPRYGRQTIRGIKIDVDTVAVEHRDREIENDAFWRWVRQAELQA